VTPTSSASFRDPENAAFLLDEVWYRIAGPSSAQALDDLHASALYGQLISEGALVSYERVDGPAAQAVLTA
jgi:hypothetical protein